MKYFENAQFLTFSINKYIQMMRKQHKEIITLDNNNKKGKNARKKQELCRIIHLFIKAMHKH